MVQVQAYTTFSVGLQESTIIDDDTSGLYWPEIDLPATATDGTVVTIIFYKKRPDGSRIPVGDRLELTYPLDPDERCVEPAGIRSRNGILCTIRSTLSMTVHYLVDRDEIPS